MHRSAISHDRLMRESSDHVEGALRSNDEKENLVARRILESPNSWQLWESQHAGLMRQVAEFGALRLQTMALRHTALRLIHGKALFEHLRRNAVRGQQRARLVRYFSPTRGYHHALVSEHGGYLRRACSYLCTSHLGADLVHDPAFLDAMHHYEKLYDEYFDMYCSTLFAADDEDSPSMRSLLPLLKHQLNEWRWMILNPRQALPRIKRESEIRLSTGDTQSLPILKL